MLDKHRTEKPTISRYRVTSVKDSSSVEVKACNSYYAMRQGCYALQITPPNKKAVRIEYLGEL